MRRRFALPAPPGQLVGWRETEGTRTTGFALGLRVQTATGWQEPVRYETVQGRLRVVRRRAGIEHTSWLRQRPPQDYEDCLQRAAERLLREAHRLCRDLRSQGGP